MLIDCDGQLLLGLVLAYNVIIQKFLDLDRLWQWRAPRGSLLLLVIGNYLVANVYAFIADIDGGTRNQLFYFVLRLSAKRTAQSVVTSSHQLSLPDFDRCWPGGSCSYNYKRS